MSRSLKQRMQREFYQELELRYQQLGLSDGEIEECIQLYIKQATALDQGLCPQCGAPAARYVDYVLQQGGHAHPGQWVQYRCSTQPPPGTLRPLGVCDFMVDIVEPEAAS